MKKKLTAAILGICFMLAGIGIAGNTLGWWDFTIFFKGWWTLFIIIPCGISVILGGITEGSVPGLLLGLLFLFASRGLISYRIVFIMLIPLILILVGLQLVFRNLLPKDEQDDRAKKTVKYFISLFVALLCVGIFFAFSSKIVDSDEAIFSQQNTVSYTSFVEEFDDVTKVKVYDNNAYITITSGDRFMVEAINVPSDYEVFMDGNTLVVGKHNNDNFNFFIFDFFSPFHEDAEIVVTIPAGVILDEIFVDSGSRGFHMEDIHSKVLKQDSGSGSVYIANCSAEKSDISTGSGSSYFESVNFNEVKFDSGSGKVNIVSSKMSNAKIDSGSGSFSFDGSLIGNCKLNSGSGGVVFSLKGNINNYYISGDAGSGGIWVNGDRLDDSSTGSKSAADSLKIDSGSGRVSVNIKE